MQEIPLENAISRFDKHLHINERVILSAKFGDGKTFFLNKFKESTKDNFHFITLYPVNYSVAQNADVFEYIKRDIILQLAQEEILCNIDLEAMADSICSWENAREVISFLLSSLPFGPLYDNILTKIEGFYKSYQEKKQTYEKFLDNFAVQKGGIYERDAYTKLIEEGIKHIQEDKRAVLIIEDLDRIDPAHLFRILNVLGAHIDCKYHDNESCPSNKFGFDHIITVFDYKTTEHIFHHFYGEQANYQGYINKFKINQPFYYSIKQEAYNYLHEYIRQHCYITIDTIDNNHPFSIYRRFRNLSVREICNLLENIDNQIETKEENTYNKEVSFLTNSSLTTFIAILFRIGIKKDQIKTHLNNFFNVDVDFLNLLGVFLSKDVWFWGQSCVKYKNVDYDIKKEIKNSMVERIIFTESEQQHNNSSRYQDVSKAIAEAINEALKNVHE